MSLPADWVDALFARLAVRYGSAWVRKWEGVDVELVKAEWARELACFASNSRGLTHALAHLPDEHPPTVTQFRAIGMGYPRTDSVPQLEAPKSDPARVAEALERMKQTQAVSPLAWAYALREREQAQRKGVGARVNNSVMTDFQRKAWREALRNETEGEAV